MLSERRYLFKVVFIALTVFGPSALSAAEPETVLFSYCVDGDSCNFIVPSIDPTKSTRIRFSKIDTPEIKGACLKERNLAQQAKAYTVSRLKNAQAITLTIEGVGFYKRKLGEILVDGQSLNQALLEAGLAKAYDPKKQNDWCE